MNLHFCFFILSSAFIPNRIEAISEFDYITVKITAIDIDSLFFNEWDNVTLELKVNIKEDIPTTITIFKYGASFYSQNFRDERTKLTLGEDLSYLEFKIKAGHSMGVYTGVISYGLESYTKPLDEVQTYFNVRKGNTNINISSVSTPKLYAAFPSFIFIKNNNEAVFVNNSIQVTLKIIPQFKNYSISVMITSDTSDFIFAHISNVTIASSPSVIFERNYDMQQYSATNNGDIHHVAVDFGVLTGHGRGTFEISFLVNVEDHPNLTYPTLHDIVALAYVGDYAVGLYNTTLTISKPSKDAILQLNVDTDWNAETKLKIGDTVNVQYSLYHDSISNDIAFVDRITVIVSNKMNILPNSAVINQSVSGDQVKYDIRNDKLNTNLTREDMINGSFSLIVNKDVMAFQDLPLVMEVTYTSVNTRKLMPVLVEEVFTAMADTPSLSLQGIVNQKVAVGGVASLKVKIHITKITMPTMFEGSLPISVDNIPEMTFMSMEIIDRGSNIDISVLDPEASFLATTNQTTTKNYGAMDLGLVKNVNSDLSDSLDNEFTIEVKAYVNNDIGLSNGTILNIGVGVIAEPNMIWVADMPFEIVKLENERPELLLHYKILNEKNDIFQLEITIEHGSLSTKAAKNLSFEFYLTPYVVFDQIIYQSDDLTVRGGKQFIYNKDFVLGDKTLATIQVRLDRKMSWKTGTFNFTLPSRITYSDEFSNKFQYTKIVTRSMKVLPRYTLVPLHPKRVTDYYGRGFYAHTVGNELHIYLCMNQHALTKQWACYVTKDFGECWKEMDRRLGCILGLDFNSNIVGVSRNQNYYLNYNIRRKGYVAFHPTALPTTTNLRILDDADYLELNELTRVDSKHMFVFGNHQIAGAGDGLYYRKTDVSMKWARKIRWLETI